MTTFAQAEAPRLALDAFLREHWRIAVPLALALVGIALALPRVRRKGAAFGGALAGAGLVTAGLWWIRPEAVWVENLLFYVFSGLAVLAAGLMLTRSNPVHSALAFALVVLSSCGLFLLLAAPFLMAATLIVYAGAIVVTFLFVIMYAQQSGVSDADLRSREPFLASLAGFVLLGTFLVVIQKNFDTRALDATLAKLDRLAAVATKEEAAALLGELPAELGDKHASPLVAEIRQRFPDLQSRKPSAARFAETAVLVDNLENAWIAMDVPQIAKLGASLRDRGQALRARGDVLEPSKGPSHIVQGSGKLPAANVAALGKTLFVDYLIPVSMAGVLLLVATIGAIAIAGRRPEGLR